MREASSLPAEETPSRARPSKSAGSFLLSVLFLSLLGVGLWGYSQYRERAGEERELAQLTTLYLQLARERDTERQCAMLSPPAQAQLLLRARVSLQRVAGPREELLPVLTLIARCPLAASMLESPSPEWRVREVELGKGRAQITLARGGQRSRVQLQQGGEGWKLSTIPLCGSYCLQGPRARGLATLLIRREESRVRRERAQADAEERALQKARAQQGLQPAP